MSSAYHQCVHCGIRVEASSRAVHEESCIRARRRAEAEERERKAGGRSSSSRPVGAPPSFKVPRSAAPPATRVAEGSKAAAGSKSGFGAASPQGSHDPRNARSAESYGIPQPSQASSAPLASVPPAFPTARTTHAAVSPVPPTVPRYVPLPIPHHPTTTAAGPQTAVPAAPGRSHAGPAANVPGPVSPTDAAAEDPADKIPEGTFQTEFHPRAGIAPFLVRADEYRTAQPIDFTQLNFAPWRPAFRTRVDFELAEFILLNSLSESEGTRLFDIVKRILADPGQLTVTSYDEVQRTWESAKSMQPAFRKSEVTAAYGKEEKTYTFYHRDLWEWGESVVKDPLLCRHFVWHAYRQFRRENKQWVRFIDEPYTADRLYEFESSLPPGGFPLAFVLYADKTRLSSFGTQQGWPIIARIANLPSDIRNSSGHGGGQVVGLLPIITDKKAPPEKLATHRRVVWHAGFLEVIKQCIEKARSGKKVLCGDQIWRLLFPLILILIADYEEQAIMALIKGLKSFFPCPVCLVPTEELAELGLEPLYPLRSQEQGQSIVDDPSLTNKQKEERLKDYSLRNVRNVFWDLPGSDPHKTLSFERLHAYHIGLFKHLLDELKEVAKNAGSRATNQINAQVDAVPSWPNLYHPSQVLSLTFGDGSKYEDISKVLVPATYNVVLDMDDCGYPLMMAMRTYSVLDMYAGLEVQTGERMARFKANLPRFRYATKLYERARPQKNWHFIKAHSQAHIPADILAKGATKHFNAKPGERSHSLVKDIYQDRTNFKDVEGQIARIEHHFVIGKAIRYRMDFIDALRLAAAQEAKKAPKDEDLHRFHHVYVGSNDPVISLAALREKSPSDAAYADLPDRMTRFIAKIRGRGAKPLPPIAENMTITPYKFMKIGYECTETWRLKNDLLRITPSWYSSPRFDWVMYKGNSPYSYYFGQLKTVFTCAVGGVLFPLALVTVYDVVFAPRSKIDRDLGLFRIRPRENMYAGTELIHLGSIIRGAFIMPDYGLPEAFEYPESDEVMAEVLSINQQYGIDDDVLDAFWNKYYDEAFEQPPFKGDCLVIDMIDGDMFLRLQQYFRFLDT